MLKIYEEKTPYSRILEADKETNNDNIQGDPDDVNLSGDIEKDFNQLIKQLRGENYDELDDALKKICSDPKLYALLSAGFGSGDLAQVKMSSDKTTVPVRYLQPSQSEIGLEDSLNYPLTAGNVDNYFSDPVTIKAPIVTFNKTWIIDGHHRWSQLFIANPEADITAINFNYNKISPLQCLRDTQGAIAVATKDVPSSGRSSTDLYKVSEKQLRDFIEKNITDESVKGFIKNTNCESKEEVIDYLVANGMDLKKNNKPHPEAPDRKNMPQTGDYPSKALDVMSQGVTNI